MKSSLRHLLHASCLAAGIGVGIVGAVIFRTAADNLHLVLGTAVITLGGLAIYAGYRILPLADI